MPVKSAELTFNMDLIFDDISNIDVDDLYSAEPLLSDDIWKKFEFDFPLGELSGLDNLFSELDAINVDIRSSSSDCTGLCEIRNHDCMWAGHCGSKEHPADEPKSHNNNNHNKQAGVAPGPQKAPAVKQPVAAGRSLLLRPIIKQPPVPLVPSPESPPISDDEEPKTHTNTLKMLNDAIDECDIDEDSDLCEYFEDSEELVSEPVEPPPSSRPHFTPESDHSYHKNKNVSMRISNLGIETPSDSEEEIDVVSVGEKQNISSSRGGSALPTNPSSRDRQQLQRTVASAITNKRISTNGIKTIPPIRKSSNGDITPVKRRLQETRGVKRSRHFHYRKTPNASPYKRKATSGQSSDSEPEPMEKRSLHNNMERQRRIDLRNAFEDLRMLVPEVSAKERAAKVTILREASLYCDFLGDESLELHREVDELRKQQERLRARVSQLRRNLASKR